MNQTSTNTNGHTGSLNTLMQVAATFVMQGKHADAVLVYDRIIEQSPAFAIAYYERGRARHLVGDTRGAMEDLKRALQLDASLAVSVTGEFAN